MATFASAASPYSLTSVGSDIVRRGWIVEPPRTAVLVHDLLPYYVDTLDASVVAELSLGVGRVLRWAAHVNAPVICSSPRSAGDIAERGLGGRLWGMGPTAREAADTTLLHGTEPHWVRKRSYSAFFATDLALELRRAERDQLIIVGVFASGGVVATAFDALANDVEAFVVADATADHNLARHTGALQYMATTMAEVIMVADLTADHARAT